MAVGEDPIDKLAYVSNKTAEAISSSEDGIDPTTVDPVDTEFERKALRKIDRWLVGFYSTVYVFRVIDSANYSNAAIINLENGTGIKKQLGEESSKEWSSLPLGFQL